MQSKEGDALFTGFIRLIGSQVFTRLITFALNQVVTKSLSVEAFGLLSIRFHLINTSILMLGREGFRRGCLQSRQDKEQMQTPALLSLASLTIPLGILITFPTCWIFGKTTDDTIPGYQTAVQLQGAAAVVELLSEPLYILAQQRRNIALRVGVEASATIAKIAVTLLLLWRQTFSEAVAISLAQVVFALVTLLGYIQHFLPDIGEQRKLGKGDGKRKTVEGSWSWQDLTICSSFTAQAFEKLLLAEGTKIAMSQIQSAYDQGVYGLVVNLGSIAARTVFQPFEEAAFLAFSRPSSAQNGPRQRLRLLIPLTRLALLVGLIPAAFGPSNTYLLLHVLYGPKYSGTEGPQALALYCPYLLLLAVNGIVECFVHAVSQGRELVNGHLALVGITLAQTGFTLLLVRSQGTLGMILADGLGMLLRILYCTWFIAVYTARLQRLEPSSKEGQKEGELSMWQVVLEVSPSPKTLGALVIAFVGSAASSGALLGSGPLAGVLGGVSQGLFSFWTAAGIHVGSEAVLLGVVACVVYEAEKPLYSTLKALQGKQE